MPFRVPTFLRIHRNAVASIPVQEEAKPVKSVSNDRPKDRSFEGRIQSAPQVVYEAVQHIYPPLGDVHPVESGLSRTVLLATKDFRTVSLHYPITAVYVAELYATIRDRLWDSTIRHKCRNIPRFSLEYRGKLLLDQLITLAYYGIRDKDIVDINFHLIVGGSSENMEGINRPYQDVEPYDPKLDREVRYSDKPKSRKGTYRSEFRAKNWTFQSNDIAISKVFSGITSQISGDDVNYVIKLIEDVALLGYQLITIEGKLGKASAILMFAKLRIDGPLLATTRLEQLQGYFDKLFPDVEVQGLDEFFTKARTTLDTYENVQNSPLFKRLHQFLMYALSLSIFEKVGVTFDTLRYTKLEQESIKRKHHMGVSFVHCLLDTLLFLSERGYQCMKTGSLDPIFHSGSSYESWLDKCGVLQRQAKFLSNPTPHGFTIPQFLMDLDEAIEKGKAIAKHAIKGSELEKRLVRKSLSDLELLKATELTRRAAGKDRKAPFSLLVFGGSGVAKSAFTKMLFYHYGKTFGLPIDSEYRYVRNPNDQFWSGFTTGKWCIQLDDIAYMSPGAAPQGDPSVLEMLQVVNSVPFVPNQAELEDKGRTPVRAQLVVATSNSEDMNAFHYFNCPLAIRRRMPYVITIQPKEEYAKDDVFLDADAVPDLCEGEYPDFWIITIKKVVPQGSSIYKQQAALKEIAVFSNIYDFVEWYSKTAIKFSEEQDKVDTADTNMAKATICKKCFRPLVSGGCTCMDQQGYLQILTSPLWAFLNWSYGFYIFTVVVSLGLRFCKPFDLWVARQINFVTNRTMLRVFRVMGERYQRQIGAVSLFLNMSILVGALYAYFKIFSRLTGMFKADFEVQGNLSSKNIGKAPVSKGESENVWFNDSVECTSLDASPIGLSWKNWDDDQIQQRLGKNIVWVKAYCNGPDARFVRHNRALGLQGQIYMINNHGLPEHGPLELTVVGGPGEGITDSHNCVLEQSDIVRYPEKDIAFFKLPGWSPRKSIVNLFPTEDMKGALNGYYLLRNDSGQIERISMLAAVTAKRSVADLHDMDIWYGHPVRDTMSGECGMPLILKSGYGPFIAGIHLAGGPGAAIALRVYRGWLMERLDYHFSNVIESGQPMLNVQATQHELGDLHRKSPFRYIPQGTAKIYGSFKGFRGGMKSHVRPTLLNSIAQEYGYKVKTGPPVMRGWEPWYNAAIEIVNPVSKLKQSVLNKVRDSFTADILDRLDPDMLHDELFIYDDLTAINGAAGVRFVDKINRKSSMGFPWKKTKKDFLTDGIPVPSCPDPKEFPEEVMNRVDDCIAKYHRGERYMPVFSGSLKDEPIKFSKIESKKTRVFCASPVDWNIVVRKYLLSFIRVLQLHSFIFESAPGIVSQSREWEDLYKFLTRFGKERMIAGDYAAFDKRMPAQVILAAFDIIIEVCRASGNYTEQDLLVIRGIAMDTAFPLVDFNGDLVELSGSNPSGHPLTVVINGLANCLYMRYCYHELNPLKEVESFTENVALMTYGDDNVMGCSHRVPWFNHTTIVEALADIDITYTMADKEAESVPYIHVEEISFLKRVWRYDDDLQAMVAPLDEDSIAKMLTMHVPSKNDCAEKQAVDVIATVVREYFWYGKDIFHEKVRMCQDMIERKNLHLYTKESTIPLWEDLRDDFEHRSETRVVKRW